MASAAEMAVKKFLAALQEGEMHSLKKGAPKVTVAVEGHGEPDGDECPECLAGECDKPEHMSQEDMEGMRSMYGREHE